MTTWLMLGFRNLLKNKRRSFVTIAAVAFGFLAINSLAGFASYVFRGIEDSYVYALGNGHLTIFRKGFLREGTLSPSDYLLEESDLEVIHRIYGDDSRILVMTPGLSVSGLLSNGQASTIMTAEGRVPSATSLIRSQGYGRIGTLKMYEGDDLQDQQISRIGIAKGLAAKLNLSLQSSTIVLAQTIDGYMNALDAEVIQLIDAPVELLDNLLVTVPLEFARQIYDTRGADRMIILLANQEEMTSMRAEMMERLAEAGILVEISTWEELRPSYLRIRSMFNVIFSFVFIVVLLIVGMSVVNTIGTAVMERTREIGTLRALGLKRHGIIAIFAVESGLLAFIGSCMGLLLTIIVWALIHWSDLTWIPPNIPKRVPIEIHLVAEFIAATFIALILLSIFAAAFPARRASHMQITDALGHV